MQSTDCGWPVKRSVTSPQRFQVYSPITPSPSPTTTFVSPYKGSKSALLTALSEIQRKSVYNIDISSKVIAQNFQTPL